MTREDLARVVRGIGTDLADRLRMFFGPYVPMQVMVPPASVEPATRDPAPPAPPQRQRTTGAASSPRT